MDKLARAESIILNQVKFIDFLLEEMRKRNKTMEQELGPSYGKFIGSNTVYERVICELRRARSELVVYLQIIRDQISSK